MSGPSKNRAEVSIAIRDPAYVDKLVAGLVHQGYAVYYNPEPRGESSPSGYVCYTAEPGEVFGLEGEIDSPVLFQQGED